MHSIFELKVLLSDRCNLSCGYCPVVKGSSKLSATAGSRAIADFLAIAGSRREVSFSGGEPLLEFNTLTSLLSKCPSESGVKFVLTTNGTLCTPQIVSHLKANNVEIKVSIDGTAASHNKFRSRSGKPTFSAARSGMMLCREQGVSPNANLVFTPSTVKDLTENLDFIAKMKVSHIDIQADVNTLWEGDSLKEAQSAFDGFAKYYIDLFEKKSPKVFAVPVFRSLMGRVDSSRQRSCHKVTLFPDGKYYLCDCLLWLPEKKREHYCIGSAGKGIDLSRRKDLFKELSAKLQHLNGSACRKCDLSSFCSCPVGGFFASCHLEVPYQQYFQGICALSRIYLKSYLRIFFHLSNNPLFRSVYV